MPRDRRHTLADLVPPPPPSDAHDATTGVLPVPPPPRPTVTPTTPRVSLAVREVLAMAPVLLAGLPLATTLWLRTREGVELVATTGRGVHGALRGAGVPCISGRELGVLALGAENGRACHQELAGWLQAGGGLRPDLPVENAAYSGCYALETPNHRWPLGPVLDAWSLSLVNVGVGDLGALEVLGA